MEFYHKERRYYCGIDLHEKTMYVCIVDQSGKIRYHKNIKTSREEFMAVVAPYRDDICVGVESTYAWYWLADLCEDEGIHFLLGHALYLKAVHGGKIKNDKIDSKTLAFILRGGLPCGICIPPEDEGHQRPAQEKNVYHAKKSGDPSPY